MDLSEKVEMINQMVEKDHQH